MWKLKTLGIILMMVGAFFPSVLYPFARPSTMVTIMQISLASKGMLYQPRLYDLEIVVIGGKWQAEGKNSGHFEGHIAIPYHYLLASGITVVFIGFGLTALSHKRRSE